MGGCYVYLKEKKNKNSEREGLHHFISVLSDHRLLTQFLSSVPEKHRKLRNSIVDHAALSSFFDTNSLFYAQEKGVAHLP